MTAVSKVSRRLTQAIAPEVVEGDRQGALPRPESRIAATGIEVEWDRRPDPVVARVERVLRQ